MAFTNFGSTTGGISGFGGTQPQQPPAFGSAQPPAFGSTQPPAFGSAQPPAFGAPSTGTTGGLFGQNTQGSTTSLFGQTGQATATPTQGIFGQQTQQQPQPTTNFAFSQNQQPNKPAFPTFGTPTANTFGAATTGAFGSLSTSTASTTGLFGQPAAQTGGIFGQSTPQTTGLFGQPQAGSTGLGTSSFGFSTPQKPTFQGFGTGTSTFGTPQTTTGFGTATGGNIFGQTQPASTGIFGQPLQQQQQQQLQLQQQQLIQSQPVDENQAFYCSIFQCNKFGDERDTILGKLNYLMASWGSGKGHYSQTLPPVIYTPSNPYYRFKAVSYAFIYTDLNEDGIVILNHKTTPTKGLLEETTLASTLQLIIQRQNIIFKIAGSKLINEDSQILVYAEDKANSRRIPSTDLAMALSQPQYKQQLENIGIFGVTSKIRPNPDQIKEYLTKPPQGLDPRVWKKAQEDNPDPNTMIPIPLVGLDEIKNRMKWQEGENLQHLARLKLITENINQIQNRQLNMSSEISSLRRKTEFFKHRLLIIIARQEMVRRSGTTLTQDEEVLKKRFEEINKTINSPTSYKGALNELLAQIQLQGGSLVENRSQHHYEFEHENLGQIRDFLQVQQQSLKQLVETTKRDLETQKKLTENINDLNKKITALRKCY